MTPTEPLGARRGLRDGERSRRRICALATRLAMMGRTAYENRCARITMMARSNSSIGAGYIGAVVL
jgi:hypothetical protein